MTDNEAHTLSIALQAVAKMTGFLTDSGGTIQEGYVRALNNFERGSAANYFSAQLPHLLAVIQYYSLQTAPFTANNAGNATMEALLAIGSAALYGDNITHKSFNNNILAVLSVLRSFGFLGETSLDMRWTTDIDKQWIVPHTFNAMGKIASISSDEAKSRFDSIILEIRSKISQTIDSELVDKAITNNYLKSAGRNCDSNDPLFGSCYVPPKVEDILTVNFACSDKITIRAQSSISTDILTRSCQEMADEEIQFHHFFNTYNTPIADDKNVTLEVIAFASPDDYKKYAGEFFGINTNNGGMYLEGTPENEGNQARFIAMQCPDAWVGGSCQYNQQIYNLKHEFIHYLDGRYNKKGGFGQFNYNVAWSEGFSEYFPYLDQNNRALTTVKGKTIPPLYNILFMDYNYEDLYAWSYFAIRYLVEQYPEKINQLAQTLRSGDNTLYIETLKNIVTDTSDNFQSFILSNSEAIAPKSTLLPAANSFGSCDLTQQYVRPIDANNTNVVITNTTSTPVSLFWINNNTGKANFSKNYQTLQQGESFTSTNWREHDRMMLTDNNLNCLGVAVMNATTNNFSIDADFVKNVISEIIPDQDQLGSCELVKPHVIASTSNTFTITNTTDYTIRLFRINNLTGKPIYSSGSAQFTHGYGTLAKGESYSNDIWYGNRRLMIADARLNCLAVGVLNNDNANFTIDENTVAGAAEPEIIPAANTIGSCDLLEKHLIGPFDVDFSFTNNTTTPLRIYRVDNTTGQLSESFGYTTLEQGETYNSATTWKWFGNRRAAITDINKQCLGVTVMTEKDTINDYQIEVSNIDSDGDGVINTEDAFPDDPNETLDSDSDGVGDNADAFPNDPNETLDSDSDGVGDNADAFPNDPSETLDSDGDGVGDNADFYPNDPQKSEQEKNSSGGSTNFRFLLLLYCITFIRVNRSKKYIRQ